LRELIEADKVTPVIDRTYPLSEVPEAIRHLGEGHARGKWSSPCEVAVLLTGIDHALQFFLLSVAGHMRGL
jgi:Zinc-binding dehydrogenase